MVAVKPYTTMPEVGSGDERFRVAKGLLAMDEYKETCHESNASVSPAIRTDL